MNRELLKKKIVQLKENADFLRYSIASDRRLLDATRRELAGARKCLRTRVGGK